MSYEFDLVADPGSPAIATARWAEMANLLLHLQPAKAVELDDDGRVIHVRSYGQRVDMAPGLPADIERLAQTTLRVSFRQP